MTRQEKENKFLCKALLYTMKHPSSCCSFCTYLDRECVKCTPKINFDLIKYEDEEK